MAGPTRNLPFSVLIICLVSIRGLCLVPTPPRGTGSPPLSSYLDDYDDYEDTVAPTAPVEGSPKPGDRQRCDYEPCRDDQTPCDALSRSTGCLCPGFTLYTEQPDPPKLTSVSRNGSRVVVQWCAPYSHVITYMVTVGGQLRGVFGESQRRGSLDEIAVEEEVCMVAMNEAGSSDRSCMRYRPEENRPPLTAWLIGGAGGLLLILLVAAMLWRHGRQDKQEDGHV
ncbi:LRRN4 C-terminal-like protein [Nematolebias whitei]|uniref:LRRN4 C-terminal-like protein n=1 Tax=Nematolebias whitei TaxID=451745 RepID=UPI0018986F21|nr:LRRN4 C-terminal-like protein [Nematolebias whitei]